MSVVDDEALREAESRVGMVLRGKWTLDHVLGIGGMATVYAATHRNGLRGAVKILHPEVAKNKSSRERFLREGYVANRIKPGAVQVLDDDIAEDGSVFLVMELLVGSSLEVILGQRPRGYLEVDEVLRIGIALSDVLARAHAAGIVHRDIKPDNLFMTTSGELRVLDFGIARMIDPANSARMTSSLTSGMGTPAFMPPEQALAKWDEVGPHSDIYSAGGTLFNLLSGELAHEGSTAPQLLVAVATKPARPLRSVAPHVPEALAAVIDHALAHEPAARWPSALAMRDALARIDLSGRIDLSATSTAAVGIDVTGPHFALGYDMRAVVAASAPARPVASLPGHPTTSPVSADQPADTATLITAHEHPTRSRIAIFGIGVVSAMLATGAVGWWAIRGRPKSDASKATTARTSEAASNSGDGSPAGMATPSPPSVTPADATSVVATAAPAAASARASASASAKPTHPPSTPPATATHAPSKPKGLDLTRSD